jgi:hypothetical protein
MQEVITMRCYPKQVHVYAGAFQFATRMNSRNARSLPGISVRAG